MADCSPVWLVQGAATKNVHSQHNIFGTTGTPHHKHILMSEKHKQKAVLKVEKGFFRLLGGNQRWPHLVDET